MFRTGVGGSSPATPLPPVVRQKRGPKPGNGKVDYTGGTPHVERAYLSLKELSRYGGLSERTLRGYLHRPVRPLPFFQVGKKILVRRLEFDEWLATYRRAGEGADIEQLVEEALDGLTVPGSRATLGHP